MDRETQEKFFNNSVDMDVISDNVNAFISNIKNSGNPKRIKVDIRNVEEFGSDLSIEEVAEKIDSDYSKNEATKFDLIRIWKQDNHYVIAGVRL